MGYPWYSTALTRTQRVFRHGYRAWRVPVPDGYLPRVPGCSDTCVIPYPLPSSSVAIWTTLPSSFNHNCHLHTCYMAMRRWQKYVLGSLGMYSIACQTLINPVS